MHQFNSFVTLEARRPGSQQSSAGELSCCFPLAFSFRLLCFCARRKGKIEYSDMAPNKKTMPAFKQRGDNHICSLEISTTLSV